MSKSNFANISIHDNQSMTHHEATHQSSAAIHDNVTHETDGHTSKSLFAWQIHLVSLPYLLGAIYLAILIVLKVSFHRLPKVDKYIPESCILLIVGLISGFIVQASPHGYESFISLNTSLFFFVLLPPIVIEAAYDMPSRALFENFGTICIYAIFNTLINTFAIGACLKLKRFWRFTLKWYGVTRTLFPSLTLLSILRFATLISAVDPVAVIAVFEEIHVNEALYILVFGESLFNDAVTVVLYSLFGKFSAAGDSLKIWEAIISPMLFLIVVLGGVTIGLLMGLLATLVTKYTNEMTRIIEPFCCILLAYFAYMLSEFFSFSGILAGIAAGIFMKPYKMEQKV